MLVVVLAAGLFPNAGTVSAQTSCPYGGCVSSSAIPTWEIVSILVVIAAAAIAAALILMRRRRPPPQAPVQAWQGAPPSGAGPAAPAAPTPPYIETPEDVGHAPPAVPPMKPAAAAGAAAAAPAAAEGEPDIDSLMAELDKISGEILRKAPKKGAGGKEEAPTEEEGKGT
jgi:hypothetical protein